MVKALGDNSLKFTVFAPTDEAFAEIKASLPNDPKVITEILKYHVADSVSDKLPRIMKTLYKEAGLKNEPQVVKVEGTNSAMTVSAGLQTVPIVKQVSAR